LITGIQLLRSIGQFEHVPAGAIVFDRCLLVYAENGRGKTTLTAVLRSLATGDSLPIRERRRLAVANPPHAVLTCSTAPSPAVFENGNWNRTLPNLVIFDDRFVDENVYSGLSVEAGHRQNLHGIVLGAQGVALNRQLQQLVRQIEEHNVNLRTRAAAIPITARGSFSIDDFCSLQAVSDVDAQIRLAEQRLAAAQEQAAIRNAPEFEILEVTTFPVDLIEQTLARNVANLNAASAARVQAHFREIGPGGETWVAEGVGRVMRRNGGTDLCPFCEQDLAASQVVEHYAVYFGEEYGQLKTLVTATLARVDAAQNREFPARFERAVRVAVQRSQFWSRFCEVPEIDLDTQQFMQDWQTLRDGLAAALVLKQNAPLEQVELTQRLRQCVESCGAYERTVAILNERLLEGNRAILVVKERLNSQEAASAASHLATLRAAKSRHSTDVSALCSDYLEAEAAKAMTEQARDRTQAELEVYRAEAFPRYQHAVNRYLERFGAGFRIERVAPADTRGGPTCNYSVLVNNTPIPVAGADVAGEPTFRSGLSSGDRNTLTLAFFLASLDRDQNLAEKIVVVDDPVSSLDDQRSLTTVQELRRLGGRVAQLIVLSHEKNVLCQVWAGLDQRHRTAIRLDRDGEGSTIALWDVSSDSITEHDRNHALLHAYLRNGPGNETREVATALRPVIEAFLRIAFPLQFPPRPGAMGAFRDQCVRNVGTEAEILDAEDTEELQDLVEYANRFHHNTNPAYERVNIVDAELRAFVERVLRFATR
jgi:wobble nucleotide-excising tRNase